MANHNVFVYGTLKSKNAVRGLGSVFAPGCKFIAETTTTDGVFDMVDLGSFPAAKIHGTNNIRGELWQIDDETFEILDQIESYPNFYDRTRVKTEAGEAWMYFIPDTDQYRCATVEPVQGVCEWNG
jgi:gamma-glutamylcyclotransferase (GGCT)/AIG2-like uncharacterized protein YtfP